MHMGKRTVVLATLALVLAGASSCKGGGDTGNPLGTNPPNTGAVCDDNAGDLSRVANERGGTLKEPAGVDIVHAEAKVADPALRVEFRTAGPIESAPNPEFIMAQGPAGQADSWELTATRDEAGTWGLRLGTFRTNARGGVEEAPKTVLQVPVNVRDNVLSYEVALKDLPRIATYVWLFGARSSLSPDDEAAIFDDCERYGSGTLGTTIPGTMAPGTTTG
jgi:hypothetical protein